MKLKKGTKMFEVQYRVSWPNGNADRKTIIINGKQTFTDFMDTIGVGRLVHKGLVKVQINHMEPV